MGLKDVPPGACGAFETITTSGTTVFTFTASKITDGPVSASRAVLNVLPTAAADNDAGVAVTMDGATDPTTSIGFFVQEGESLVVDGAANVANVRFTCKGVNLPVSIHYVR